MTDDDNSLLLLFWTQLRYAAVLVFNHTQMLQLFQPSSTSVWNDFILSKWKLAWNYFKVISEACCSSWIFSNMFIIA